MDFKQSLLLFSYHDLFLKESILLAVYCDKSLLAL